MKKKILGFGAFACGAGFVSARMQTPGDIASAIGSPLCSLLQSILNLFKAFFPALFVLMLIYGATKYIFSADDPGGRKVGKTRMIHAIIGIILLGLIRAILDMFGLTPGWYCNLSFT